MQVVLIGSKTDNHTPWHQWKYLVLKSSYILSTQVKTLLSKFVFEKQLITEVKVMTLKHLKDAQIKYFKKHFSSAHILVMTL